MSNSASDLKKLANQQAPGEELGVNEEETQELPPEREKNIKRRTGFEYFLTTIEFKKGMKFGLGIKHYRNMVVVSKVDEGSMCAQALSVFDHICDVDGSPVTDKDVTKTLLVKSLQKNQKVSLLVARPACQEAGEMMEQAINAAEEKPPSLTVAADVRDIMRRLQAKLQTKEAKPKSIMTSSGNGKPMKTVSFMNEGGREHKSMLIMTDISHIERLQKVKKPEPPAPSADETAPAATQEAPAAMVAPLMDDVLTPIDKKKSNSGLKSPVQERSPGSLNSKNTKSEVTKATRK